MSDRSGPQSVFWALFSLQGRIRRATYGWSMALIFCVWWVAFSQLLAVENEETAQFGFWAMVLGLLVLVSGYNIYALCHKRIHDLGHRGTYALLLVVAAFFFSGFLIIPLVLLGVLKGQPNVNAYGPPPVS